MFKCSSIYLGVAALLAATSPAVRAQGLTTPGTTTTITTVSTTEFTPIAIPTIAPAPCGPNGQPIDYTVLAGKTYDFMDLNQARAEGFGHREIATIAKLADEAGTSFDQIKHLVSDGLTFVTIADNYNVDPNTLRNVRDYEEQIAAYRLAYEHSGSAEVRQLVAASQEEMVNTPNGAVYSETGSLADTINNTPELSMYARLVRRARLMKVLNGPGPLTVFAPTDAAFAKLSNDQISSLMRNRDQLVKILDYGIIPQRVDAAQGMAMTSPTSPATLEGDSLQVVNSGGNLTVNGANLVRSDVFANNGVIHEVDTLLLPPSVTTITTTTTTTTAP
jgi:uncharacterized surface protein with fasciclin (FAS1) repeats